MSNKCEEAKKTLLSFCSSELTSHAANIIGLSILLFAFLGIATEIFETIPLVVVGNADKIWSKAFFDYFFFYLMFWILVSGILFAFMRLVYYGHFAHNVIVLTDDSEKPICTIADLRKRVMPLAALNKFSYMPANWFAKGVSIKNQGLIHSFIWGGVISQLLFYTIFFTNYDYLMLILIVPLLVAVPIHFVFANGIDYHRKQKIKCPYSNSENELVRAERLVRDIIECVKCKKDIKEKLKKI